ncbi:MAG: hypothetical protein AB8B91_00770 [Rubripirellula sp.]
MAKKLNCSDLDGKSIAFYGQFAYWPQYHRRSPESLAREHGAKLRTQVDTALEILVLGDKRGTGRADAKKKGIQLQKRAAKGEQKLLILDEAAYREMVRAVVARKSFCFCGEFDCCPSEMHDVLEGMVTEVKGKVSTAIDRKLDFLVVGNRRAKGKTAAIREAQALQQAGGKVVIVDESGFLELVRVEGSTKSKQMDFASFVGGIYSVADERKVQRALKMLQKESFQLYSKANKDRVVGIVRSQTGHGTIYAPWIKADGRYGCSTPELSDCMGLQGSMCKHLVVLLLGLVRVGELDAGATFQWIKSAGSKRPQSGGEWAAESFLEYRGVEAGDVDWRPTETVPEDFYSF